MKRTIPPVENWLAPEGVRQTDRLILMGMACTCAPVVSALCVSMSVWMSVFVFVRSYRLNGIIVLSASYENKKAMLSQGNRAMPL